MSGLEVTVIDLGKGNTGSFGPDDLDMSTRTEVVQALGHPEYCRPASNNWICVDGRTSEEERANPEAATANPQIAGSIPVSETAASYMDAPETHRPESVVLAQVTSAAVADKIEVTIHGDDHGEAGCAANARKRDVLRFNAANADIVGPKSWAVAEMLGMNQWVNQDDVAESIVNGQVAANSDALWDVTPEEGVAIMKAKGAKYETYNGPHMEATERVDLSQDGAFAKAKFVAEQSLPDRVIHAFAASVGAYYELAKKRAEIHGKTERDAALLTLRVLLFNVGLSKMLLSEQAQVGLITPKA